MDSKEEEEKEEDEEEKEKEDEDEENEKSDSELNMDGEQNIGYDTVCAICDNGGEILPYVFTLQVSDHKDLLLSFAYHPLLISK